MKEIKQHFMFGDLIVDASQKGGVQLWCKEPKRKRSNLIVVQSSAIPELIKILQDHHEGNK